MKPSTILSGNAHLTSKHLPFQNSKATLEQYIRCKHTELEEIYCSKFSMQASMKTARSDINVLQLLDSVQAIRLE